MSVDATIDHAALDATVADLRAHAGEWTALALAEKVALLDRVRPRVMAEAPAMVAETQRAKGIDPDTTWGAEDWLSGPWAFLQGVTSLLTTLRRVERGEPPVPTSKARTPPRRPDGRRGLPRHRDRLVAAQRLRRGGLDAAGRLAPARHRRCRRDVPGPGLRRARRLPRPRCWERRRHHDPRHPAHALHRGLRLRGEDEPGERLPLAVLRPDLRRVRVARLAPVRARRRRRRLLPRPARRHRLDPHDRVRHHPRRDRLGERRGGGGAQARRHPAADQAHHVASSVACRR